MLVCDSSRKGKSASAKHVATTEILIGKRAIRLQKKRVRGVISVESDEHREGRLKRTRQHERDVRSLESEGQRNSRMERMREHEQDVRSVESEGQRNSRLERMRGHQREVRSVESRLHMGMARATDHDPFYTQSALNSIRKFHAKMAFCAYSECATCNKNFPSINAQKRPRWNDTMSTNTATADACLQDYCTAVTMQSF